MVRYQTAVGGQRMKQHVVILGHIARLCETDNPQISLTSRGWRSPLSSRRLDSEYQVCSPATPQ